MWVQTGSCPQCGAPIYAPGVWHGVIPPPPHYTCNCASRGKGVRYVTTTATTYGEGEWQADGSVTQTPFREV